MDAITQGETLAAAPLEGGERVKFFTTPRLDGMECLTARFRTHRYAPHRHETYAIGSILAGVETWRVRGGRHYGGAGDLLFINPLEAHDGGPLGGGYSYRMTYPSLALLQEIALELSGGRAAGTPFFAETAVRDPEGAALFLAAHRLQEAGDDALAADEALLRSYAYCLARHASVAPRPLGRAPKLALRLEALLTERLAEDLTLEDLVAEVGLSRSHLIRAFRRETGLTPHAYLLDRRVDAARRRLRRGERPAAVAAATGFCDQAHLTGAFKARLGVTPAAYRTAVAA